MNGIYVIQLVYIHKRGKVAIRSKKKLNHIEKRMTGKKAVIIMVIISIY